MFEYEITDFSKESYSYYQIISKSKVALPAIEQNKNNLQSEKTLINK